MKAVLGHGTGPCAMEKLIQLINYCSCLPQHQSRDPLAPAARAKRKAFLITAGHCILPLQSLSRVHSGEFSLLELVGNPREPQAWARLWETWIPPRLHILPRVLNTHPCCQPSLPKPGLDPGCCWVFTCLPGSRGKRGEEGGEDGSRITTSAR